MPRPQRFPIRTPFRYRESGGAGWRQGMTIDISRTGVLFYAECELPLRTILEMQIGFPREMTGCIPGIVLCCGSIVRAEPAGLHKNRPILAAIISNYRFVHQ